MTLDRTTPGKAVRIRELPAGDSLRRFIDLSWKINAGDPNWVAPLRTSLRKTLRRDSHPFHRHADVAYFLAERDGEAVGRIAAIVNHRHNDFHEDRTGFFGFFESVDDPRVTGALVDAASEWLRARGMERIRGPMSFSTNEEAPLGVLVEGFQTRPFVMIAHNPPYYDTLLRGAGLDKARDLFAYYLEGMDPPKRFVDGVARRARRQGVTVRSLDLSRFEEEIDIIKSIYNSAWQRNWGFVPMTEEEFDHLARDFKPIVDPHLCLIAEIEGEPVGFSLALPNLNEILRKIPSGRLFPTGLLRILFGKRKIRGIRVLTAGFKPGYQHLGLGAHLYLTGWQAGVSRGYDHGEASWILEDNTEMRRVLESIGGVPYKRFRIYEREL